MKYLVLYYQDINCFPLMFYRQRQRVCSKLGARFKVRQDYFKKY